MAKTLKCELCGAKARQVFTKEFDGKVFNFCCRGCLEVYELMRAEGLVQTKAEENYFSRTPRINAPMKSAGRGDISKMGTA